MDIEALRPIRRTDEGQVKMLYRKNGDLDGSRVAIRNSIIRFVSETVAAVVVGCRGIGYVWRISTQGTMGWSCDNRVDKWVSICIGCQQNNCL